MRSNPVTCRSASRPTDPTLAQARRSVPPKPRNRRRSSLVDRLAAHPGRAFSRDYLLARLWRDDYEGLDRTVDTHITRLRKKLGPLGERIATVWGVGYRFMV